MKEILRKAKYIISFAIPPALLLYDPTVGFSESYGGRISLPCRYHFTMVLHALISPGG
jgi:hypothetical protein